MEESELTEDELIDDAEVDTAIRESIGQAMGDSQFSVTKVDLWSRSILEGCLKRLAAMNKPFKFVVTCNLSQKAGAGLHVAASSRWMDKTDGKMMVQWDNQTTFILTTVYWLCI